MIYRECGCQCHSNIAKPRSLWRTLGVWALLASPALLIAELVALNRAAHALPDACRDEAAVSGLFTTDFRCRADARMESAGAGQFICRCVRPEASTPPASNTISLSGAYPWPYVPTTSDAGASWVAK